MIGILLQKGRQEHREHGPQAATGYAATGYAATLRPELPRRRRRKTARTRVSCSTPRATLSWIGTHPASDKPLDRNSIGLGCNILWGCVLWGCLHYVLWGCVLWGLHYHSGCCHCLYHSGCAVLSSWHVHG